MTDINSTHSTLREQIVERVFIGDLLRTLWRRGIVDVEVLYPEFDAHGYDVILVRKTVVRHIQLKTGKARKPPDVSVSRLLANAPSGCVLWIHIDDALNVGPFYWFGAAPGAGLPSLEAFKVPHRATHNKQGIRPERIGHRLVPKAEFRLLANLDEVLYELFGAIRA